MQRRVFSREFKLEEAKLVTERGVAVVQAARDLDVAESVLRRWIRDAATDTGHAFPGHCQVRPEQQEIDRLGREVAKLRAECDILKKAAVYFARDAIWDCPDVVDGLWTCELRVGFCRLHAGLVGHGRAVAQAGLQPDRIVPALDVAEAGHAGLGLGCEPPAARQLGFQC